MSSYDIALVMDASSLNKGMTQLYGNSVAQQKLFKGNQNVGASGIDSVDWQIGKAPQFVLTPPTLGQWNDPNTFAPHGQKPANPTDQMFQVQLDSVNLTLHMQDSSKLPLSFALTVFVQVGVVNQQVQLSNVAVLPSNFTPVSQLYLEIGAGVVYDKVQALLQGYQIPSSIPVEGQNFTAPVMTIANGYLAIASNLVANGTPNISGVQWPKQPFGVLVGRKLLSALLNQYNSQIQQQLSNATVNKSDSSWTGNYSLNGGISHASISLGSTLPNVNLTATFSATATVGVSWWAVPGACALEAASNLLP